MDEFVLGSGYWAGELLYYLGTHPGECRWIAALSDEESILDAMTRIEHYLRSTVK
jgi:hypothetical protein